MSHRGRALVDVQSQLVDLVEELLEAHRDTVEMALEIGPDPDWASHGDYLKRLQREARAVLARLPDESVRR